MHQINAIPLLYNLNYMGKAAWLGIKNRHFFILVCKQIKGKKRENKQTLSCKRQCLLPFPQQIFKNISVCPRFTSLCSFLHLSAVTISWLRRVGMVSDFMTLGGGGGALNKPSSLWELLSLLLLDKMAWGNKEAEKLGSYQSNKICLMTCPQDLSQLNSL